MTDPGALGADADRPVQIEHRRHGERGGEVERAGADARAASLCRHIGVDVGEAPLPNIELPGPTGAPIDLCRLKPARSTFISPVILIGT